MNIQILNLKLHFNVSRHSVLVWTFSFSCNNIIGKYRQNCM